MLDERDGLGVEEHEGASAGEAHASGAPTSPVGAPLGELTSTELGVRGEQAAARYLAARGWEILERNWRCPYGEADIVARDVDGTIVLVEVKTRRETDGETAPEEAVGEQKRRRYRVLAAVYLADHPATPLVRFDVVALTAREGGLASVRHIVNAFGASE